jgi:hypothetical protein
MGVTIKMTCHSNRENLGELWQGPNIRDQINGVGKTGICGDPVFFSFWGI